VGVGTGHFECSFTRCGPLKGLVATTGSGQYSSIHGHWQICVIYGIGIAFADIDMTAYLIWINTGR
jgi:hypothetical protein